MKSWKLSIVLPQRLRGCCFQSFWESRLAITQLKGVPNSVQFRLLKFAVLQPTTTLASSDFLSILYSQQMKHRNMEGCGSILPYRSRGCIVLKKGPRVAARSASNRLSEEVSSRIAFILWCLKHGLGSIRLEYGLAFPRTGSSCAMHSRHDQGPRYCVLLNSFKLIGWDYLVVLILSRYMSRLVEAFLREDVRVHGELLGVSILSRYFFALVKLLQNECFDFFRVVKHSGHHTPRSMTRIHSCTAVFSLDEWHNSTTYGLWYVLHILDYLQFLMLESNQTWQLERQVHSQGPVLSEAQVVSSTQLGDLLRIEQVAHPQHGWATYRLISTSPHSHRLHGSWPADFLLLFGTCSAWRRCSPENVPLPTFVFQNRHWCSGHLRYHIARHVSLSKNGQRERHGGKWTRRLITYLYSLPWNPHSLPKRSSCLGNVFWFSRHIELNDIVVTVG